MPPPSKGRNGLYSSEQSDSLIGLAFMSLFGLAFTAAGVFFLVLAFQGKVEGDEHIVKIVPFIFILAGLGVFFGGIFSWRKSKKRKALVQKHVEDPWMTEKDWAQGRIKDSRVGDVLGFTVFAVFWNAISWTITISLFMQKNEEGPEKFFVLLFPLIGIAIGVSAGYKWFQFLKFGTSWFEMAEIPGVIGGTLGGVIRAKAWFRPQKGVDLKLQCIYQKITGSGKHRRTHEDVLWESSQLITKDQLNPEARNTLVPVFFEIPYDCQQTHRVSNSEQYYWKLSAEADLPGVDYQANFKVPVFKTENSRPDAPTTQEQHTKSVEEFKESSEELQALGINLNESATQAELHFERTKSIFYSLIPFIIGGSLFAGAIAIYMFSDIPIVFPIFLGTFGVFVEMSALSFLVARSHLLIDSNGIVIKQRGLTGEKRYTLATKDIREITPYSTMTIGNTAFYGLEIKLKDGNSERISAYIKDNSNALKVCRYLKARINLH